MKKAIIIGAGPAGLTAAYELLQKTDIKPVIYEAGDYTGGISRTVCHNGNRMDIGGHRFFTKSERVMDFWQNVMPIENEANPDEKDRVFLVRNRRSRILFCRKFIDYPVRLSPNTLINLGFNRMLRIALSYFYISLFPLKHEKSLEDFYINRFGKELYSIFFKDYTRKVWGVPCSSLPPEWGFQRIKGLSFQKALLQALKKPKSFSSIEQKNTETSLIDKFLYPKYGPGQFWQILADKISKNGGEIHFNSKAVGINISKNKADKVTILNSSHKVETICADYVFSTMPVKDLVASISGPCPNNIKEIAEGLVYRDFMTIGLYLEDLLIKDKNGKRLKDNWIYVQDNDVLVGRLQIFNNWSPFMVKDISKIFLGMEFFVNEGDEHWKMQDEKFIELGIKELVRLGFIKREFVLDAVVIRVPKAYPAYLGPYERFSEIVEWNNTINNLYLIGRNGMHRYNNSDHSSLSAMTAVDNIINKILDKTNIWSVNTENEYHEGQ